MNKVKRRLILSSVCSAICLYHEGSEAGAVATLDSAQDNMNRLRDEGRAITAHEQNKKFLSDVKQWISETESELEDISQEKRATEADIKNMQYELAMIKESLAKLAVAQKALAERVAVEQTNASEAYAEAARIQQQVIQLQQEIEAAQQAADNIGTASSPAEVVAVGSGGGNSSLSIEQAYENALADVGYDENRLVEAEVRANMAMRGEAYNSEAHDNSAAIAAQQAAAEAAAEAANEAAQAEADARVEAAQNNFDAAMERLDELNDIVNTANDVVNEYQDMQKEIADQQAYQKELEQAIPNSENYAVELADYMKDIESELSELNTEKLAIEAQLRPIEKALYASQNLRWYSWKNDRGDNGHQLYSGVDIGMVENTNTSVAIRAGRVNDSFSFLDTDSVAKHFTDTSIDIAQTNPHKKYNVIYRLGVSLPTGDSTKSSSQVPVITDLTEFDSLGNGSRVSPGLTIQRKIGKEDMWTYSIGADIKGGYTNSSEQHIEQGTSYLATLGWQHVEEEWQFAAQLSVEKGGTSRTDDLLSSDGNNVELQLTYNNKLNAKDDLAYFYWYVKQGGSDYRLAVDFPYDNSGQSRHYYGVDFRRLFNERRSGHIMVTGMTSGGSSYDARLNTAMHSVERYSIRAGYSYVIDDRSNWSIDMEHFYLKDKVDNIGYHGNNIFAAYNKSF